MPPYPLISKTQLKVLHYAQKCAIITKTLAPRCIGAWEGDWFFVDEGELLSVEEMTRILKVSKPTIQRWCRDRKLPAAKIGKAYRIRKEDLDRWYEGKLLESTVVKQ